MKTTWIPPIISKILGIKNVAGTQINPATEETLGIIASSTKDEDSLHASGDK